MIIQDLFKPRSDTLKWLAFSCAHVPLTDEDAEEFLLQEIETHRPDVVVNLGDLFEADYASRWPSVYDWTWEDELVEAQRLLQRARLQAEAVNPEARCVMLLGNHDKNCRDLIRVSKKFASSLDWQTHVREIASGDWIIPEGHRYTNDPHWGVLNIGQVCFGHGWTGSEELWTQNNTLPYGLGVWGHTHKPTPVRRIRRTTTVPLPFWVCNAGCLRSLKPSYVSNNPTREWGHAVAVGESHLWRYTQSMIPNSPQWAAEVRVLRTGDGYAPEHQEIS